MIALRNNKPAPVASSPPAPLPTSSPAPAAAPARTPAAVPAPAAAPVADDSSSEWLASDWEETEEVEAVDFPIADYDDLTAGQILPLLPQLYPDEIGVVEARELSTKARPEILDKLTELRGETPAAPAPVGWDDDEDWFPIEDYESLSAAQIRPLLAELDAEELELVRTQDLGLVRRR